MINNNIIGLILLLAFILSVVVLLNVKNVSGKTKWYNKQYDEYMQKAIHCAFEGEQCRDSRFYNYAALSSAWSNLAREIRESENK